MCMCVLKYWVLLALVVVTIANCIITCRFLPPYAKGPIIAVGLFNAFLCYQADLVVCTHVGMIVGML